MQGRRVVKEPTHSRRPCASADDASAPVRLCTVRLSCPSSLKLLALNTLPTKGILMALEADGPRDTSPLSEALLAPSTVRMFGRKFLGLHIGDLGANAAS